MENSEAFIIDSECSSENLKALETVGLTYASDSTNSEASPENRLVIHQDTREMEEPGISWEAPSIKSFLSETDNAQGSDICDRNSLESVRDANIKTAHEDSFNTIESCDSHSKDAGINNSGTSFTHSRQSSSSKSEKRVRIETTPLCLEVEAELGNKSQTNACIGSDDSGIGHIGVSSRKHHIVRGFEGENLKHHNINIDCGDRTAVSELWLPSFQWNKSINRRKQRGKISLFKRTSPDGLMKVIFCRSSLFAYFVCISCFNFSYVSVRSILIL
ncbi:hypothetical protein ElyMa_001464700 [Elysia marginata]|uniref:Uncharacterized protein n=1 Tax=Elysia marginata TaxID=1093978 RepID=A0AAV4J077_9GAST|nr:hypothetical protein ElyMa_001464700 [Elysia marginata]